jgi:hypothetical protein
MVSHRFSVFFEGEMEFGQFEVDRNIDFGTGASRYSMWICSNESALQTFYGFTKAESRNG